MPCQTYGAVVARKRGPRLSIIPAGAVKVPSVSPNALRVLCLFGTHTDNDGWCRRSQTKMAEELGCSRSSIQRGIEELQAAGWLQSEAGGWKGRPADPDKQPFAAHHYRVILDPPDEEEVPTG